MTDPYVWKYKFPFNPISLNDAYRIARGGGHKFLHPWMYDFKDAVKRKLRSQDSHRRRPKGDAFGCSYLFLFQKQDFYHGNGTLKRHDITNYFKLIEDSLFDYLKLNDTSVFDVYGHKRWVDELPLRFEQFSDKKNKKGQLVATFMKANVFINVWEIDPKRAHLYDARLWTMMPDSKLELVRRAGQLDQLEAIVRPHCIDDIGFRAVMASIDAGLMGKDLMNKINMLIESQVVRLGIYKPLAQWLSAFVPPPAEVAPPPEPEVQPPAAAPTAAKVQATTQGNAWRRNSGGWIFHEALMTGSKTEKELEAVANASAGKLTLARLAGLIHEYSKGLYKHHGWGIEKAGDRYTLVLTYPDGRVEKKT